MPQERGNQISDMTDERSTDRFGIEIKDSRGNVQRAFNDRHQNNVLAHAVKYFVANEGLLDAMELPFTLPNSDIPVLSSDPNGTDNEGRPLDRPVATPHDDVNSAPVIYVYTNLDRGDKIERLRSVARHTRLTIEFTGKWAEDAADDRQFTLSEHPPGE